MSQRPTTSPFGDSVAVHLPMANERSGEFQGGSGGARRMPVRSGPPRSQMYAPVQDAARYVQKKSSGQRPVAREHGKATGRGRRTHNPSVSVACQVSSIIQLLVGGGVAYATFAYLHESIAQLGLFTAAVLCCAAIAGLVRASHSPALRSARNISHAVLGPKSPLLLAAAGILQNGQKLQVHRQTQVDCTIVFLNQRLHNVRSKFMGRDKELIFDTILARMEQLYDHMGSYTTLEETRRLSSDDIRFAELDFLHRKLESLQNLAEAKLLSWKKHEDEALRFIDEVGDDQDQTKTLQAVEEGVGIIRRRVMEANRLLQDLDDTVHGLHKGHVSYQEVMEIEGVLREILGTAAGDEELEMDKKHLEDILLRKENVQSKIQAQTSKLEQEQATRRKAWARQFNAMFAERVEPGSDDGNTRRYSRRGVDFYSPDQVRQRLPKYCVEGVKARRLMDYLGLVVTLSEVRSRGMSSRSQSPRG
eukprot:scaffold1558_cov403-Prasinococcus_capsulatus_cf.AAC.3